MGRGRDHSEQFVVHDSKPVIFTKELHAESLDCEVPELTPVQLAQRQKQIDYGKNTLGYQEYLKLVPKAQRMHWKVVGTEKADPMTPDAKARVSKRTWDGRVKTWRKALHKFDPSMNGKPATQMAATATTTASGSSSPSGSVPHDQQEGQPQTGATQSSDASADAAGPSKKRTYTTAACGKENAGTAKRSQQEQQQRQPQQQQEQQGGEDNEQETDQHKQQDQQQQQQQQDLDKSITRMVCSVVADVFGEWVDYGDDDIF